MVKSQEDWGKCPEEHKLQFVHSVEKYVHVLSNATSKSGANSQQVSVLFFCKAWFSISGKVLLVCFNVLPFHKPCDIDPASSWPIREQRFLPTSNQLSVRPFCNSVVWRNIARMDSSNRRSFVWERRWQVNWNLNFPIKFISACQL